jgi:hypothetical protein
MDLDLVHRRNDPCLLPELGEVVRHKVDHANPAHPAFYRQSLSRAVRVISAVHVLRHRLVLNKKVRLVSGGALRSATSSPAQFGTADQDHFAMLNAANCLWQAPAGTCHKSA